MCSLGAEGGAHGSTAGDWGGGGRGGVLVLPGSRNEVAEVGRKPQLETEGMLMMPAVVRRPYRDLMGDIMGGTLSGAAFLRRCLGTGSEASACSKRTSLLKKQHNSFVHMTMVSNSMLQSMEQHPSMV